MSTSIQRKWRVFSAVLLASLLAVTTVRAVTISFDAWVQYAILDSSSQPLADGSWVYIMGSLDNSNDGFAPYGDRLISDSTQGDDVILAMIQIKPATYNNDDEPGTFFVSFKYDPTEVQYMYLRFFEYTNSPVTGTMYWGYSEVYQVGSTLGVGNLQFDANGQLGVSEEGNFVVIPEPTTGNLIVLVAGMIWAMRSSMRRNKDKKDANDKDPA